MASRFVARTALDTVVPLRTDDHAVIEQYALLRDWLASRLGPEAAELFAEPVPTWSPPGSPPGSAPGPSGAAGGSVSWYADLPGEPEPLSAMPAERRAAAEAGLRRVLARLQPLRTDPQFGVLLTRALVVASPDDVRAFGTRVVLTGWGLAPAGAGQQADPAMGALGPYLPPPPAPAPVAPPALPGAPVAAPRPAATTATPLPAAAARTPSQRSAWSWWLVPAALALGSLLLVLGFRTGARLVAERAETRPSTVSVADEAAVRASIERQRQENAALERQLEERRRQLEGNVCSADPAQVPRPGPDRQAPPPAAAIAPPPPGGQPFQGSLAELLTQAVVLVLAKTADGASTGTGFFIAPDLIVTNRHVIEEAVDGRILVTSAKLGRTTPATVVAQTPNSEMGKPDLALLRVQGVPAVQPLALTREVKPLDQVIAAGFPGLLMRGDAAFERLLRGDAAAVPQVILTDGRVNAIQDSPGGIRTLPHSAAVSGGNSGGPLVDACGRVVGVNTLIAVDREQVAHANYAQMADGVGDWLRQNGVQPADAAGPCPPTPTPTATPGGAAPGAPPEVARGPGTGSAPSPGAAPGGAPTTPSPTPSPAPAQSPPAGDASSPSR